MVCLVHLCGQMVLKKCINVQQSNPVVVGWQLKTINIRCSQARPVHDYDIVMHSNVHIMDQSHILSHLYKLLHRVLKV